MGSDKRDRITPAVDLSEIVRHETDMDGPTSEVRPLVTLNAVPRLTATLDELRELPIDPRAAFLVSLFDGQCTVQMLADVSGMPRDEVMSIIATLVQVGAVELKITGDGRPRR